TGSTSATCWRRRWISPPSARGTYGMRTSASSRCSNGSTRAGSHPASGCSTCTATSSVTSTGTKWRGRTPCGRCGRRRPPVADQDVIDVLLAQHAEIERLFEQIIDAEGETRRHLFEELVRLLSVHETAEEELVHPLSRGEMPSGDEVIDARLAEER